MKIIFQTTSNSRFKRGEGSRSLVEGPGLLSKMQGLEANQSERQNRGPSPQKRGFPQIGRRWEPRDLEVGTPQGWRPRLLSGRSAGSSTEPAAARGTCLQHPRPPGGVLLKGQRQRQWCQLHQDLPRGRRRLHPPFLCVSGRSFWGTPCWEVTGGVVQAPHSGTGSDMQHISLGPIPALPVRLILGVQPGLPQAPSGRYGGGRGERRPSEGPG